MQISSTTYYYSVNDFPQQVQEALEMKGISTSMSEIQNSHEQRQEETDEINQQTYSG
jgi:hypothetical protein